MVEPANPSVRLTRFAWLSIAAALLTISMKAAAYFLTGSVGLFSDTLESTVNPAAAVVALLALRMLSRPADEEFAFGYSKVEYFSSGFEGGMILLASLGIIVSALPRLFDPQPLEQLGFGILISICASLINLGGSLVLMRAAKRYKSITLEADARHLMTDVITTTGVLLGVAMVWLTGFNWLDPIIALLVALNILITGYRLVIRSIRALLDIPLPPEDIATVKSILDSFGTNGVRYHALRSRQAAKRKFLVVHLLVPGSWTVREAHKLAEKVEMQVEQALPHANIVTHIEPVDDPASLEDASLD